MTFSFLCTKVVGKILVFELWNDFQGKNVLESFLEILWLSITEMNDHFHEIPLFFRSLIFYDYINMYIHILLEEKLGRIKVKSSRKNEQQKRKWNETFYNSALFKDLWKIVLHKSRLISKKIFSFSFIIGLLPLITASIKSKELINPFLPQSR